MDKKTEKIVMPDVAPEVAPVPVETPEEARRRKAAYRKANGLAQEPGSGFGAGTEER